MDSSERSVKSEDQNDIGNVNDDEGDEELDPRIKVLCEMVLFALLTLCHLPFDIGSSLVLRKGKGPSEIKIGPA